VEDGEREEEDEEVGDDVQTGVGPVYAHWVAIGVCAGRSEVPECRQRDACGEEADDDVDVANDYNAQHDFRGQTNAVVGQDADVEAENRELGEAKGQDVEDGVDETDFKEDGELFQGDVGDMFAEPAAGEF